MSRCAMIQNTRRTQRGEPALSRERIISAAIDLLDTSGESGLTFRALAAQLATGAGAIYFHISDKGDLLGAACDSIVVQALATADTHAAPQERLRAIGLALFDAIDAHPWVGAALSDAPGTMPTVRILESVGQQVQALGVPDDALWAATSALLSYILGVAGQNAANARLGQARNIVREDFLHQLANRWGQLDAAAFPFTRAVAAQLPLHDDRADFLAGIDLILVGIAARRSG